MTDLDLIESRLREHFDEYGEALPAIARVRARVAELESGIHHAKKPMEGGFSLDKFMPNTDPETARAMGEMFDQMEAKKKLNGWIPCGDAKPPVEEKVMLCVWEGDWNNPRQSRQIRLGRFYRNGYSGVIGSVYRTEEGEAYEITHWMPLPAFPAE